jgi:hypothetical protein
MEEHATAVERKADGRRGGEEGLRETWQSAAATMRCGD